MPEQDDLRDNDTGVDDVGSSGGQAADQELDKLRRESAQLKQELAHVKKLNSNATPWITRLNELYQSGDEGKTIIEKLQRGELLTKKEKAAAADEAGLTKKDLEEFEARMADAVEQRIWATDSAREGRKAIDEWASKEFEGYNGLRNDPHWRKRLARQIEALEESVKDGASIPTRYGDDLLKWAISREYAAVKADNPQLGEKKRVPAKTPEEIEAAKLQASSRSGSSTTDEELPEDKKNDILEIRRLTQPAVAGKSFAQRR
jgi:hypothetical protein